MSRRGKNPARKIRRRATTLPDSTVAIQEVPRREAFPTDQDLTTEPTSGKPVGLVLIEDASKLIVDLVKYFSGH